MDEINANYSNNIVVNNNNKKVDNFFKSKGQIAWI